MTRSSAAFEFQSNPDARRSFRKLPQNTVCAEEAAFQAAALSNRENESRLDRRHRLVHVLAVKGQARFEPQRVARSKPDRQDLRL